ncbi:hypothetical protein R1sor_021788 [Riccia sorocarpa]|uniref:Uncharacterized protein n=1 Tax=Riccia sorocarpa TaxID=122646 RepID=A0ABD3GKZ6_9MARC
MTISRLEADLKAARQDVSTQAKQDEELEARLKSVSGQMEVLKDATIAKLREELAISNPSVAAEPQSVSGKVQGRISHRVAEDIELR